jgi:taurine dioxygenase
MIQVQGTAVEIVPLSDVLGVEVRGVDLGRPLDEQTRAALREAFVRHHMLLLRDQAPLDEDHVRFCEVFGPVQAERLSAHLADKRHPAVHYVSNTRADGVLPEGDRDLWMHTDQTFYDRPSRATSLFAFEIPREGGETLFGNLHMAYEALSGDMKRRLEGLKALNCYLHDSPNRFQKVTAEREENVQSAVQPVVRTHPDTGRKALYVSRLFTDRIIGMEAAESDALLGELFALIEEPRFIHVHKWHEGDMVIWDNASLTHGRRPYDHTREKRSLRRVTVQGGVPY